MKKLRLFLCLAALFGVVAGSSLEAQTVTLTPSVGNGTTGSPITPFGNQAKTAWMQMIYNADYFELPAGGTITDISYYCSRVLATMVAPTITIYMGTTTDDVAPSTRNVWVAEGDLTEVYSGSDCQPTETGWFTIHLTTPFVYDGQDNLVVVVSRDGSAVAGLQQYYYTTYAGQSGLTLGRINQGATHPGSNTGTVYNNQLPNTRFTISGNPGCYKPYNLAATDVTETSATLTWTPGLTSSPESYAVEIGARGFTQGTGTEYNTTTNSLTLSTLTSSTAYDAYITSNCSGSATSATAFMTFATACPATAVPYTTYATDFSAVDAGEVPDCWNFPGRDVSGGYPQIGQNSNALKMTTVSGSPALAVLPAIDGNIENMQLSVTTADIAPSGALEFGYVTDVEDASTFVSLGTVASNSDEVYDMEDDNEIAAYGNRFAFRFTTTSASPVVAYLWKVRIDDAPDCKAPKMLHLDSAQCNATQLAVAWSGLQNDQKYRIRYKVHTDADYTTISNVSAQSYTLTPLTKGTYYDILVDRQCDLDYSDAASMVVNTKYKINLRVATGQESYGAVTGETERFNNGYANVQAVPAAHYTFKNWNNNALMTDNPMSVLYNDQGTFVAYFAQEQHTLTVQANEDAYGTVSGGGTYNYNSAATITATPNVGYKFVGWSTGSTDLTTTVSLTGDLTVTAYFANESDLMIMGALNNPDYGTVTNASASGIYTAGQTVTISVTPNDHYSIYSWTGLPAGAQETTTGSTVTKTFVAAADAIVTANLMPVYYTVTVGKNDDALGSVNTAEVTESYGTVVNLLATPADNCKFLGWYNSTTLLSSANPYAYTVTGDAALTAAFEKDSITVSIASDDALRGSVAFAVYPGETSKRVAVGDAIRMVATPNEHYTFGNWSDGTSSVTIADYTYTASGTASKTFTAVFSPECYTISAAAGSHGSAAVTTPGTTFPYLSNVVLTATPDEHYVFTQWNDANTDNPRTVNVTGNATYTASFEGATHTITATANGNGSATASTASEKYGNSVNVTVTPALGYEVGSWTVNGESVAFTSNPQSFTVTGDMTIVANMVQSEYTITIAPNNALYGNVTGSSANGTYHYGDVLTLEAAPAGAEYLFVSWSAGAAAPTSASTTWTVTGSADIVATFGEVDKWTISASVNNNTYGSVTKDADNYLDGTLATITATATDSTVFSGWNVAAYGQSNPLRLVMTANITGLVANFSLNSYTVTTQSSNNTYGVVSGGGQVEHGSIYTVTATPQHGYRFSHWTDGNDVALAGETSAMLNLRVASDTTVKAVFVKESYTLNVVNGTGSGEYEYQTVVSIAPTVAEHMQFVSWQDGSTENPRNVTVTDDATYTATTENILYTVSAVPNDQTKGTVNGGGSYAYGAPVTLTATPASNCRFLKWSDDVTDNPRSFTMGDANLTLTAQFAYEQYNFKATADATYGSIDGGDIDADYDYNTVLTITAVPNPGVEFQHWSNGSSANPLTYVVRNEDSIWAVFDSAEYTLTLNLVNPSYGLVTKTPNQSWYRYGDDVTLNVSLTDAVLYKFVGWENNSTSTSRVIHIVSDTVLTAIFGDANTFAAVAIAGQGGTASVDNPSPHAAETVTFTAVPDVANHYHFVRWSDNSTDNPHTVTIADADVVLTAIFALDQHTLTLTADNGSISGATNGNAYDYGTELNLYAAPAANYHFSQWTDGNTDNPRTVTITADTTFAAQFVIDNYTVSAVADPAMGSTTGSGVYDYGTVATLTATAAEGRTFSQWTKDGVFYSNNATINVTVTTAATYVAEFTVDQHTLTATVNDGTMGYVTPNQGSFAYNTVVTLTATAFDHHHFVQWTDGVTTAVRNVTVTSDTTFSAVFAIDSVNVAVVVEAASTERGTVDNSIDGQYPYGAMVTFTATPATGYVFDRWSHGATANPLTEQVVSDVTREAVFAYAEYTMTATTNDAVMGSVMVTPSQASYHYGDVVNVTATVSDNDLYKFISWSDGETTLAHSPVTMTGDVTLMALFGAADMLTANVLPNNDNWGSIEYVTPATVYNGQTVTVSAHAAAHYHFDSWSDDATITDTTRVITVNSDTLITALFAIDQHTVALNTTGDGTVSGAGTYDWNSTVTLTATPAAHYHFVSWSDAVTDAVRTLTVAGDTVVTALFALDTHTVVANAVNGTVSGNNTNYAYGEAITLTAAPADTFYTFAGWTVNGVADPTPGETLSLTMGDNDLNITATYTINQYALTVNVNNNAMGSVSGNSNGSYDYGTVINLTAQPAMHHHFENWNGTDLSASSTFTLTGDTVITANFAIDEHLLTISSADAKGTVNDTVNGSYAYGTSIEIEATPATGCKFVNWSDGNLNATRTIVMGDVDITLTANFDSINYNVTIASNNTTMGHVTGLQSIYRYGDTLHLTAVVDNTNLYKFTGWSDGTETAELDTVVKSDINLMAIFAEADKYTLLVQSANMSMGTVDGSVNGSYNLNDEVTITAIAAEHYHFLEWNDGDTNAVRTITIIGNLVYTAYFEADTHAVTLLTAANGTLAGDGSYDYGSTVTLEATAAEHYHFLYWTDENGTAVSNDNPYSFTLTQDTTYGAMFALDTHNVTISSVNGTVTGDDGLHAYGDSLTFTSTPLSEYYDFAGWTVNGVLDTTTAETLTLTMGDEDLTIVATYTIEGYSFSAASNDMAKGYVTGTQNGTYETGTAIEVVAHALPNNHFVGWSNGHDTTTVNDTLSLILTQDTVYTAIFAADLYSITATVNDPSMGSVTGTGEYMFHELVTLTAVPAIGHHFMQWSDGETNASRQIYVVENVALEAIFAIDTHTVSVSVNDTNMGNVTGAGIYTYGSTVVLHANPNPHFKFIGFNDAADGIDSLVLTVTGDTNITATFSIDYLTLNVSAENATVSATVNGESVNADITILAVYNSEVSLSMEPAEGYVFKQWKIMGTVYDTTSVTDSVLVGYDTIPVVDPSTGDTMYYEYNQIWQDTIINTVVPHIVAMDSVNTPVYNFNIVNSMVIVGETELVLHTLTVTASPAEGGVVTGAGEYIHGTLTTISATPNTGWTFVGWSDGDTNAIRTVTVTSDTSFTANFVQTTGIDDNEMSNVKIYASANVIYVNGAEQQTVRIFDAVGRMVSSTVAATETERIVMSATGIYMVQVGNAPAKRVVVMR